MGACKVFVQSFIILFTCIAMYRTECPNRYKDNVPLKDGVTCVDHTLTRQLQWGFENQNGLTSFCHYFYRNSTPSATEPPNTPPTRRGGARGLKNLEILDILSVLEPDPDNDYKHSNWKDYIEMGLSYIRNDNFKYALVPYKQEGGLDYKNKLLPYRSKSNTTRAPDIGSPNPWFVEASGISIKGDLLHNWLHFRVFMNRSVRDERSSKLHTERERRHHSTGYISAMIMMIKDQEGYPIGDFSQEIPCHKTCRRYSQPVHYGNQENAVPCAYTPPRATSHPGMFVFDVDPGNYDMPPLPELEIETTTSNATGGANDTATNETVSTTPTLLTTTPEYDEVYRKPGVREVHATWSYNQDLCNYVSEIHVQTLIFEEFYKNESMMCSKEGHNCRYYGWSAQYNILYPKGKESLGAADYVNINYWKNRDKTFGTKEIDCHVPFFDALRTVQGPFIKGVSPHNIYGDSEDFEGLRTVSEVVKVPNKFIHMAAVHRESFQRTNQNPSAEFPEYYGVANLPQLQPQIPSNCRNADLLNIHPVAADYVKGIMSRNPKTGMPTVMDFLEHNKGVKCPCPALPSPEPLELRTADPARLHGRLIHASHMAIAYMFLVPLSCFVARYYKETFITVFCFQEYWWFMWHVVLLMIAATFTFGAVIALYRSGAEKLYVSDNLLAHKIMGFFSITVFAIEIVTGFFRRANPSKRLKQIFFHWLIGNLNIFCAVGSMFAMAFESASGMSCDVVYTMLAWLFFVILWFVLLDIHLKHVDKRLDLQPPRSYLPPPVVRLFNRDAPGRKFRMIMLFVYIVNLLIIQYLMSYFLWHSEGKTICYQEWRSFLSGPSIISLEDLEDEEYNFDEE